MSKCRKGVGAFTDGVHITRDTLQRLPRSSGGQFVPRERSELVSELGTQLTGEPGMIELQ